MTAPSSLFDRVGGALAVRAVVLRLYRYILADDKLAPYFVHIGIERLRHSQEAFVSYALGGPSPYTGKSLREAHVQAVANGLGDIHFDLVAGYLEQSMRDLRLADDLIAEAMQIVGTTRNDVLNK